MNLEHLVLISFFLVFTFWLLHKYAVQRAIYLVNMELKSVTENLTADETMRKIEPTLQLTTPFRETTGRRVVEEGKNCKVNKKIHEKPSMTSGGPQSIPSF